MSTSPRFDAAGGRAAPEGEPSQPEPAQIGQMIRWGGVAGVAGVASLLCSAVVVGVMGLPDASDLETLTDFSDIETGRIVEHFFYLGAVMLFALHVFVLHQTLRATHPSAALFGTVMAGFGYVIMAASALLHVSTSPLADLYDDPDRSAEDLHAIEYAWHGAQSLFDTMLTTGVLLVSIGIVLFGVAMRSAPAFGPRLPLFTIALGTVAVICAAIAVIDPGSLLLALSVLGIAVFHLSVGWRTLKVGNEMSVEVTNMESTPTD